MFGKAVYGSGGARRNGPIVSGYHSVLEALARGEFGEAERTIASRFPHVKALFDPITDGLRERHQLREMVDAMPINVMMCDRDDFRIRFANRTSLATLERLQSLLPIPVKSIVGHSIDIFHKTPQRQRTLLADPATLPHRAVIRLGDERLELNVSAIRNSAGDYVGPMLTWSIITEEVDMAERVNELVQRVADSAKKLTTNSEALSQTASTAERNASEVAVTSDRSTTNVHSVAGATEELSSSIAEISARMAEAATRTRDAAVQTETAQSVVAELAERANEIDSIIALINQIAGQTNLLALNATIESARAGESGKGFAVVAAEVKTLAHQTHEATNQISNQIKQIQDATRRTVDCIRAVQTMVSELSAVSDAVAAAAEQQRAATGEISQNVQQTAAGTERVSQIVGDLRTQVGDADRLAKSFAADARTLEVQAEGLRIEAQKYLRNRNLAK